METAIYGNPDASTSLGMITVFFKKGTRLLEAMNWMWARGYVIQAQNFKFHSCKSCGVKSYTGPVVLVNENYETPQITQG